MRDNQIKENGVCFRLYKDFLNKQLQSNSSWLINLNGCSIYTISLRWQYKKAFFLYLVSANVNWEGKRARER